jgi:acetyl esterase/lipase
MKTLKKRSKVNKTEKKLNESIGPQINQKNTFNAKSNATTQIWDSSMKMNFNTWIDKTWVAKSKLDSQLNKWFRDKGEKGGFYLRLGNGIDSVYYERSLHHKILTPTKDELRKLKLDDVEVTSITVPLYKPENGTFMPPFTDVRVYTHKNVTHRENGCSALVYMHGGGWTIGRTDDFDIAARAFAKFGQVKVFMVNYSLAPEYKWPRQLNEAHSVIDYLAGYGSGKGNEGVDPTCIGISGDSAGGNMTCVIAQDYRITSSFNEHNPYGIQLKLQMPLYPETRLPFDSESGVENRDGFYLVTSGIFKFARNVLNDTDNWKYHRITPLNINENAPLGLGKGNVKLAPALLITNGFDPLRDVGKEYAIKLFENNVDLTYIHFCDLTHGFIQFPQHSKRCMEALLLICSHLKDKLSI